MKNLFSHFDKLLFILALGLVGFSLFKVYGGLTGERVAGPNDRNQGQEAKAIDADYDQEIKELKNRFEVAYNEDGSDTFIAQRRVTCENTNCLYLIRFDETNTELVCPSCKTKNIVRTVEPDDVDDDEMLDEWEREHGLNPEDPSDAYEDLDGDLFPNKVEFDEGTEPQLDSSMPDYFPYLYVDNAKEMSHPILLENVITITKGKYAFNLRTKAGRLNNKKIGDVIGDYELMSATEEEVFDEKLKRKKKNVFLTLKQVSTGSEIRLEKGSTKIQKGIKIALIKCNLDTNFSAVVDSELNTEIKVRPAQQIPYTVVGVDVDKREVYFIIGDDYSVTNTLTALAAKQPSWLGSGLPGAPDGYPAEYDLGPEGFNPTGQPGFDPYQGFGGPPGYGPGYTPTRRPSASPRRQATPTRRGANSAPNRRTPRSGP